jgi:hypothetical protein
MKTDRFTESSGTKLTSEQRARLMDAAEAAGLTESEFIRHLIVSALDISSSARTAIVALTIGEERVRLMLEAVQEKKRLDAPDVKTEIEMEALSAGIWLAEQRIATLVSLRLGPPK